MAARELEAAQSALRKPDYDDDSSEDEGEMIILSTGSISASPERRIMTQTEEESTMVPSPSFDPYAPTTAQSSNTSALMDDVSVHTVDTIEQPQHHEPTARTSLVPGGAGYLEMEEAVPSRRYYDEDDQTAPITTSSGLVLTHRKQQNRSPSPGPSHYGTQNPERTYPIGGGGGGPLKGSNFSSLGAAPGATTTTVQQRNGMQTVFDKSDPLARQENGQASTFYSKQRQFFEVEHGFSAWKSAVNEDGNDKSRRHSMPMLQARRLLSYVRIWMVLSAVFLIVATGVMMHAFGHHSNNSTTLEEGSANQNKNSGASVAAATSATFNTNGVNQQQYVVGGTTVTGGSQQIILVPMQDVSDASKRQQLLYQQQQQQQQQQFGGYQVASQQQQQQQQQQISFQQQPQQHGVRRALHELRQEFEDWAHHHGKQYRSTEEKEHRFLVWTENHHRTMEKNQRHGPCRLTKQPVFGSNHFKDLSPEEFKTLYLTGYNPPRQEELEKRQLQRRRSPQKRQVGSPKSTGKTLTPGFDRVNMHDSIKQRILQDHGERILKQRQQDSNGYTMRRANCDWYDVACMLRWLWNEAGVKFGSIVGTMEPKYDADAYPSSLDWRNYGIVTEVRSQGNCGACWAITAVETVESAHALATGDLYDLSEAEIITCDTSCEMCFGGWPQNAFEWVMKYGGLPLYNTYPYDGDKLLAMSNVVATDEDGDESSMYYSYYSWTESSVEAYREQVCPAGGGGGSKDDSEDYYYQDGGENENYADNSDKGRYGNIKGYGYATDRCICYSDGSGCQCNNQDEELAVANLATYGPAVVCIDAALWQDYSGGIMTSDIGCGSEFLDVNHCAQVVGYAYTDGSEDGDGGGGDGGNSNSGSQDEGGTSGKRSGYWILKNSWTGYWGMNGYAYIAMGENTCGILNDMTQAYL